MPEKIIERVMNSYKDATIQIQAKEKFTDKISIEKGVKQGYTLNPMIFNLEIDPLKTNNRERYQEYGYEYHVKKKKSESS
jgi:hypothetical protein